MGKRYRHGERSLTMGKNRELIRLRGAAATFDARPAVAEGYGVAGRWLSAAEFAAGQPSQGGYDSASTATSTPGSRGQRPRLQFSSFLIRERGENGYSA
jgi:hypothetical protein